MSMERSTSRGREALHSSGRGGLGNIRLSSASRERNHDDDFSPVRGREMPVETNKIHSSGRGGAGNIRSASPGAAAFPNQREIGIVEEYENAEQNAIHSFGRGGLGNISRSKSREPALAHSANHPSFGHKKEGGIITEEPVQHDHDHHSTERSASQPEDHGQHTPDFQSTGRGGAGNIRDRSSSQGRHGISNLLHKVVHPHEKHDAAAAAATEVERGRKQ